MAERVAFGILVVMAVIGFGLFAYSQSILTEPIPTPAITRTATPSPTSIITLTDSPTETIAPLLHPKNCKTAVAYGMTARQAAAEGLDRDQDGEACYGD